MIGLVITMFIEVKKDPSVGLPAFIIILCTVVVSCYMILAYWSVLWSIYYTSYFIPVQGETLIKIKLQSIYGFLKFMK